MQVAIVKYNAGNIYSVVNALRRMGIEPILTDDAEQLMKADRVLFPGQGHAAEAMEMGADCCLVNTAIAVAGDPVAMADAFRQAVIAGRQAYLAGLGAISDSADATSPLTSFLNL